MALQLLIVTAVTEDEVESGLIKADSGLILEIVVGEGSPVLELLPLEVEVLLVNGNAFLILDLGLDVFDGIGRLNIDDGVVGHSLQLVCCGTTCRTRHPADDVESRLLLYVVVREGSSLLKLLTSEYESLLDRITCPEMDLVLNALDGIRGLELESDAPVAEINIDEELHAIRETQDYSIPPRHRLYENLHS